MEHTFVVAGSAQEAASLKNGEAAFLAGGTEINRLGSLVAPQTLISVRKISELKGIADHDGEIEIGSGCTFQEAADSPLIPDYLRDACLFMGSRTKRNMATIGGNIAMLRDDSYLLPTLLAADARLKLMDAKGECFPVSLCSYVRDNAKYKNALILSVIVPKKMEYIGSVRQANTVESNARLTVSLSLNEGRYRAAAAIKKSGLYVLDDLAELLAANPEMSEEEMIRWASGREMPMEDDRVFGSETYRRYLLGVTLAKLLSDSRRPGAPGSAGTSQGLQAGKEGGKA